MTKTLLHIVLSLALACSVAACSDRKDEPQAPDDNMVNLSIAVYAGDPEPPARSRLGALPGDDYFGDSANKHERIRSMRVVVLRPDGTVEHNVHISDALPAGGVAEYTSMRLKVVGGETKKIYLFANEESLPHCGFSTGLGQYTEGMEFPVADITAAQLAVDPGKPLIDNTGSAPKLDVPMNETFDVEVRLPQPDGTDREQSARFFITRAAVKFSFHFKNDSVPTDTVAFSELTIESLGNREYLMPRDAEYVPGKYPTSFSDRYIKAYTVPGTAKHVAYTFHPDSLQFTPSYKPGPDAWVDYAPEIYFAESKLATDKQYTLKFKVRGREEYYDSVPLPNLPSLPRNTHVKINVEFKNAHLACRVDILPYTAVPLNPEFGFDQLLPRPVVPGDVPPWLVIDPNDEYDE